jgi:hypothetical protein
MRPGTLILAVSLGFASLPSAASSTVEGTLSVDAQKIKLTHARAYLFDNAEGTSSRKKELRILLTDREVPASSLYGTAFPPIWHMGMKGEVQGILIDLDPADPKKVNSILLLKPKEKGRSLMSTSINVEGSKVFQGWKYGGGRVSGSISRGKDDIPQNEDVGNVSYTAKFDIAVDPGPPVTQDLKGAQALASPQVKALMLSADAMVRADFPALKKLASVEGAKRIDELIEMTGAQAKTIAKQSGTEMKGLLKKVKRVVVRGDRATVILPEGNSTTVVREGGAWKADH